MDQWESAGAMMQSTNCARSLLSVVYDDAPAVVMESYVTNQGKNDAIVNALAAIPALTPSSLIYAGEAHLSWYHSQTLYQQILKYQRIWLASHVLYGSSRLGTKDYLPGQIYSLVDYQQAQPVIDTAVLNSRRTWYSGKYNDNIQANATTAWGHTQTDPFGSSERIGEKQYELTNHLGNVQATVSDNPYLVAEETTDTILATHPALRSAYDYYPFGMLMPGRYVSDTSQHCVTVTQPTWGWKEVTVACWDVYSWQWPGYTRTGEGTAVVDGDAVKINAPNATDAVSFDFPVTPNVQQELSLDIKQVNLNDKASVQIMEQQGENWVTLAQSPVNVVSGGMTIPFRPTGSSIRVVWHGKILVWVRHDCISKLEWVEEDQLVTICDGDKDKYRFGYNGQEKVNEWAGIGNYYQFSKRGFDSRIGRFLSVDPVASQYPWNSPYNFAEDRVIDGIDLEGAEYLNASDARVEFKFGVLQIKVDNLHRWDRNAIYRANENTSLWNGSIGVNTTLAKVIFSASAKPEPAQMSDIPEEDLPASIRAPERYESTGGNRAARRLEERNGPDIQGPMGRAKGFTVASVVVDAAVAATKEYIKWCGVDDIEKINAHSRIASKVANQMQIALRENMVPKEYQNKDAITNIMNVMLEGVNNTKDPGIYKTGMKIFNHFNPQPTYVPSGLDNFSGKSYPNAVIPTNPSDIKGIKQQSIKDK